MAENHKLWPRGGQIITPHIGRFKYDGLGMSGFLQRHGVDEMQLRNRSHPSIQNERAAASCVQEWLFFGLLDEMISIFGVEATLEDFVYHDESIGQVITIDPLKHWLFQLQALETMFLKARKIGPDDPQYMAQYKFLTERLKSLPPLYLTWARFLQGFHSPSEISEEGHRVERILDEANMSLVRLQEAWVIYSEAFNETAAVLVSCTLLIESLGSLADWVLGPLDIKRHLEPDFGDIFASRMKANGFCASHVDQITAKSLTLASIAATLEAYDTRNHGKCTPAKCLVNATSIYDEGPLHVVKGCKCNLVRVDEDEVVSILRNGSYPIICFHDDDYKLETRTQRVQEVSSYVVVSHVWMHGLGNPHSNSLYSCQVQKLRQLACTLGGPGTGIWIDTLCVPVSGKNRDYRRVAIQKLRLVYADAPMVLVLDKRLQCVGSDAIERKSQLLCSEWIRRLWTLQESYLPPLKRIHVAYKSEVVPLRSILKPDPSFDVDAVFDPDRSFGAFNDDFTAPILYRVEEELEELLEKQFLIGGENQPEKFLDITVNLHRRTTTNNADEPICLATLLELPIEDFQTKPTMPDIYSRIELPQELLFAPGPRCKELGFTWAPSTLLGVGHGAYYGGAKARLAEGGFIVQRHFMHIYGSLELQAGAHVAIRDENSRVGFSFLMPEIGPSPGLLERLYNTIAGRKRVQDPVLLLNAVHPEQRGTSAVLISNAFYKHGTWYGNYEVLVNVRIYEDEADEYPESTCDFVLSGSAVQDEYQWCVS